MNLTDWIQSIALLVATLGLLFSMLHNRIQLKILNKQMKLNFFMEYTRRYQEIMINLPEQIRNADFSFSTLSTDNKMNTLKYIRAYIDLCSEEYDLWLFGNLEERIWNNWRDGIEYSFTRPAFIEAWHIINLESSYYPEFTRLMNEIIMKNDKLISNDR